MNQKKLILKRLFAAFLIVGLGLSSCKKKGTEAEPEDNTPDNATSLNDYLTKLTAVTTGTPINTPITVGTDITEWNENTGTYCTTKKYKIGPAYNEGFILSPTNDVIFPGAILDGNSIYTGAYRLVSLPRTGGRISTDHAGGVDVGATIKETVKSQVQQGLADILNRAVSGSAGAQINFEVQDVNSESQLDVALGYTLGVGEKLKIKAGMKFDKSEKNSRVLIKFQQIYYTVSYDSKTRPNEYFQSTVTSKDVHTALDGTPISPVYVSNVKYGRVAYYSISSNLSQQELNASLSMQLNLSKVKQTLDAEVTKKLSASNTEISGTIIGGSGSDAVGSVTSLEGFYSYITQGGEYTSASPGLPIAYTLRRLSDNGVFVVQNTSEYVIRTCRDVKGEISLNSLKHFFGNDGDRIKGNISMQIGYDDGTTSGGEITLWNATERLTLPTNGTEINLADAVSVPILYNPEKFDKAFLTIKVDLKNFADWSNQGVDNVYVSAESASVKNYKIYLKDIANPIGVSSPWSNTGSGVFNLNVDTPEASSYSNHCTDRAKIGNACKSWANQTYYRQASTIGLLFTINVINPNN